MAVEIVRAEKDDTIPVRNLRQGQIGVIVKWVSTRQSNSYIGLCVQCFEAKLYAIGSHDYWDPIPSSDDCRVRVLPNGTLLRIVNNI